ncbi:hypothetical protein M5G07_08955 [Serratia symbiotica]|nr:hypothetical protein [Serratia symbiotica]
MQVNQPAHVAGFLSFLDPAHNVGFTSSSPLIFLSLVLLYSLLIGIYYQDAQQHRLAALCKQSKYQKNLQGKGNYAFTEMGQTNDRGTIAS